MEGTQQHGGQRGARAASATRRPSEIRPPYSTRTSRARGQDHDVGGVPARTMNSMETPRVGGTQNADALCRRTAPPAPLDQPRQQMHVVAGLPSRHRLSTATMPALWPWTRRRAWPGEGGGGAGGTRAGTDGGRSRTDGAKRRMGLAVADSRGFTIKRSKTAAKCALSSHASTRLRTCHQQRAKGQESPEPLGLGVGIGADVAVAANGVAAALVCARAASAPPDSVWGTCMAGRFKRQGSEDPQQRGRLRVHEESGLRDLWCTCMRTWHVDAGVLALRRTRLREHKTRPSTVLAATTDVLRAPRAPAANAQPHRTRTWVPSHVLHVRQQPQDERAVSMAMACLAPRSREARRCACPGHCSPLQHAPVGARDARRQPEAGVDVHARSRAGGDVPVPAGRQDVHTLAASMHTGRRWRASSMHPSSGCPHALTHFLLIWLELPSARSSVCCGMSKQACVTDCLAQGQTLMCWRPPWLVSSQTEMSMV